MPSHDVNAVMQLAEASWRRDKRSKDNELKHSILKVEDYFLFSY